MVEQLDDRVENSQSLYLSVTGLVALATVPEAVVNLLSLPAATVPAVAPVVTPMFAEELVPELVIGAVTLTTPDGP
jgi:hypothetical protein